MATPFLFDIEGKLSGPPVCTKAQVAAHIPHRGDIFMLDELLWHDEGLDQAIGVHHVPEDAWWASGHMPGMPLMPGVLQVECAAQLSALIWYMRNGLSVLSGFTRIDDVRFRDQVRPGDDLLLLTKTVKYSERRFITQAQGVVNGVVAFEGQITGMAFSKMGEIVRAPLVEKTAQLSQQT